MVIFNLTKMAKLIPLLVSVFAVILAATSAAAAEMQRQNEIQRPKFGRQLFQGSETKSRFSRPGSGQSPSAQQERASPATSSSSVQQKVDPIETILSLLNEGNQTLTLEEGPNDLIVLIGNTGCGTTTLTKFVSGNSGDMESFWSGNRFLIKDAGQLINGPNSTLESRTKFPTFFEDEKSLKGYYDLPGFSPTLGSATEIASHLLSQRVMGHAQRLKIILVINHSSLKPGESRVDLKNLLDHAIDFIKNPAKFHPALALIATKVQTNQQTHNEIVQGMADFIQNLKDKIPEIFGDEDRRQRVSSLVDTLLSKESDGSYGRLGYLPQPVQSSENLVTLTPFQDGGSVRQNLDKLIHENLVFVDAQAADQQEGQILVGPDGEEYFEEPPQDFGLPLSPAAKYFVKKSADRVENKIGDFVEKIGAKIVAHFSQLINAQEFPENILHSLYTQLQNLKTMTVHLSYQLQLSSLSEYFEILKRTLTTDLDMGDEVEGEFEKMTKFENYLKFLDQISTGGKIDVGAPRPASKKWTIGLDKIVRHRITTDVYSVARKLNDQTETLTSQIGTELKRLYTNKIERTNDQKTVLLGQLLEDTTIFENLVSTNFTTFNPFVNESVQSLNGLESFQVQSRLMARWASLTEDIDLLLPHGDETMPSPFKTINWLRPFETLVQFLKKEHADLEQRIRDEDADVVLNDLVYNVTSAAARFQNEMSDHNSTLVRLEKLKEEAEEEALRRLLVEQGEEGDEFLRKLEAAKRAREEERRRQKEAEQRARELEEAEWLRTSTTTTTTTTTTVATTTAEPFVTLYSPRVTNWGNWSEWDHCPPGTYVNEAQLKVQAQVTGDNSALNGVKFTCTGSRTSKMIKGVEGPWGTWWTKMSCGYGSKIIGFQLRSEKPGGRGQDETAANNLRIFCDNGYIVTGGGMPWGDWTAERRCPNGGYICGLKTQVEQDMEDGDDTGLNNIAVRCCND